MKSKVMSMLLLIAVLAPGICFALPDTLSVIVTDVTPNSACLVWLTDIPAEPSLDVYSDESMSNNITHQFRIVPMPGASVETVNAAKLKGVLKVRVQGLNPETTYFIRAVTTDAANPDSKSFSALRQLTTLDEITNFTHIDGDPVAYTNDIVTFPAYIIPGTSEQTPGLGDIIILNTPDATGPVSSFVGEGIISPGGVVDLNNLFGQDGRSLVIGNGEKTTLTVYRGGELPSLVHFRWLPDNTGMTEVSEPVKGNFADFNLDGTIDITDFQEFSKYYRTNSTDDEYNPDYDFVDDPADVVDIKEFSKFSEQYGNTGVQ